MNTTLSRCDLAIRPSALGAQIGELGALALAVETDPI